MRIVLALFFVLTGLVVSAQDEHKSIELTENQNTPVEVVFSCCKLRVSAVSSFDGNRIGITVDVENTQPDPNSFLLLFGHSYTEKDLKSHKPSIRFDRISYGTTSKNLMLCPGLRNDEVLQVAPNAMRSLNIDGLNKTKLTLPMYLALYKNRKKFIIMQRVVIDLDITIQQEFD